MSVDYHAWTHRPKEEGGTDPITPPPTKWAWIGRTSTQSITSGSPTNPDFTSGGTNDDTIFNVDQTNNLIEFLRTGIYTVSFDFVPEVSGNTWVLRLVCNASSPMASSVDLPEEERISGASGCDPNYGLTTSMFVNNLTDFTPTEVHGLVQHSTGSNKNLLKAMIRVVRLGDFP